MTDSTPIITKYRPVDFSEVIGNTEIVKSLADAVRGPNCPHAYLFTGIAGTGKTTLARIIAKEVKASILEIDAASHSGVDDTRGLVEASGFTPITVEKNRLYIIDEAHNMSKKAWEPLLKLIEEPPSHLYIALCTTDAKNIPETIKSRCHPVALRPLKSADIQDLVSFVAEIEGWPLHNDVFMPIVMAAEGSARKALSILQAGHLAQSRDELSKIILEVDSDTDPAIELCRYLMSGKREWRTVSKLLTEIENPDEALQNIARYLIGSMGRSEDQQAHEIWNMLYRLMSDSYWDKKVQLWYGIGQIIWMGKPF